MASVSAPPSRCPTLTSFDVGLWYQSVNKRIPSLPKLLLVVVPCHKWNPSFLMNPTQLLFLNQVLCSLLLAHFTFLALTQKHYSFQTLATSALFIYSYGNCEPLTPWSPLSPPHTSTPNSWHEDLVCLVYSGSPCREHITVIKQAFTNEWLCAWSPASEKHWCLVVIKTTKKSG